MGRSLSVLALLALVACTAPTGAPESAVAAQPAEFVAASPAAEPRAAAPVEGSVIPPSSSLAPETNSASATAALPASVDLRERLLAWQLPPRPQGARGTCSIFTVTAALEFALAHRGEPRRLSPEFVNWAAGQAGGAPSDGNFFHNALAGLERFGACTEARWPYREAFDAALAPSAEALAEAAALRDQAHAAFRVHWIVPWATARFGVDDAQFAEFRSVLARGFPVGAGSAHSRLLVGYRDDAAEPGGGVFLVLDSALARFDEVTYAFVREQVADAFWIEALPAGG